MLAAFEMDEILYELGAHSTGLNAGRWDYIFSVIKKLGHRPEFVLPDRGDVTMTVPFMRAYTELLVKTCHRRGAHAIGGMAAFIPSRRDPEVNAVALAKVREDKEREAATASTARGSRTPTSCRSRIEVFDRVLGDRPNQLDVLREDVDVERRRAARRRRDAGRDHRGGLRNDISVGIQYIASWLQGLGRGRDLQPDGGCGDRGDLALAGLAVAPPRQGDARAGRTRTEARRSRSSAAASPRRARCSSRSRTGEEFVEFLTLPAYAHLRP